MPVLEPTPPSSSPFSNCHYSPTIIFVSLLLLLPTAVRQFGYATISDVVLHVAYTAREGGQALRDEGEKGQLARLNSLRRDVLANGLWAAHGLRRDFPAEWWQLVQQRGGGVGLANLPYFETAAGIGATVTGLAFLARKRKTAAPPSRAAKLAP